MDRETRDILERYGSSLAEVRKMIPKLTEAATREQVTPSWVKPRLLTPEQAREFGIELGPGWSLKVSPPLDGEQPRISYISPEKWEITEDDTYISPEGKRYTREELEAEMTAARAPTEVPGELPAAEPAPEAEIDLEELERVWAAVFPEQPRVEYLTALEEASQRLQTLQIEIAGGLPFEELITAKEEVAVLEQELEDFWLGLKARGRTPEAEALLKMLGAGPEDMDAILGPGFVREHVLYRPKPPTDDETKDLLIAGGVEVTEADKIIELSKLELSSEEWLDKWKSLKPWRLTDVAAYSTFGRSVAAGYGDLVSAAAGVAGWMDKARARDNMMQIADVLRSNAPPMEPWRGPESLIDPRFWVTTATRVTTLSFCILPVALLFAAGGWTVAGAAGLGTFATTVVTLVAGSAGAGALEAGLESGSAYNEAIDMGFSHEKAADVAQSVYWKNFALLTGTNVLAFGIAFVPNPLGVVQKLIGRGFAKWLIVGGRVTGASLTEGGQEFVQEVFTRQALGLEVKWDDETKLAVVMGSLLGGLTGGAGSIFVTLVNKVKGNMSTEQRSVYDEHVRGFEEQGLDEAQAQLQALDRFADTEQGKAVIEETLEQLQQEEIIKNIRSEDAQERVAWQHIVRQREQAGLPKAEALVPGAAMSLEQFEQTLEKVIAETNEELKATRKWLTEQRAETGTSKAEPRLIAEEEARVKALQERLPTFAEMTANPEEYLGRLQSEFPNIYDLLLDRGRALKIIPAQAPRIPRAEPGQPEAGFQPPMLADVTGMEVRPRGKGRIVQISMEDQLKLERARAEALPETEREEPSIPPEEHEQADRAQAQIEGLQQSLSTDPVAQKRILIGKKKVGKGEKARMVDDYRGLDFFISLREQTFPEYFTIKQATALRAGDVPVAGIIRTGRHEGRVPRDVVLDELTKELNMTPDEIADRVEAIRREKGQIAQLQEAQRMLYAATALELQTDLTGPEVAENWRVIGQPKLTLKEINALAGVFADYLLQPSTSTAWELTRQLRRESRSARAENLKARAQQLIVQVGLTKEQAMKQAITETMSGGLPVVTTEYLDGLTAELRDALFAKVYHVLKNEPFEMMSTITALTNALAGKPIPREPGVMGGSALARLERVFHDKPKVVRGIRKMALERKPLDKVVESLYFEVGKPPLPLDPETTEWLRKLQNIPYGVGTLFEKPSDLKVEDLRTPAQLLYAKSRLDLAIQLAEGEITRDQYDIELAQARNKCYPYPDIPRYEPPIDGAIEQMPMFPRPALDKVIRILKEIAWAPVDIGNFLRANKASFDFSFWRQQAPLILNHPVSFVEANVEAWKALWSQKAAEASFERILHDPLYHIYDQSDHDFLRPLTLAKGTSQWRGVEEFGYLTGERLIPSLTEKIPYVKVSARSFVTGCNEHNWRIYKHHYLAMLKVAERIAAGEVRLKPGEAFDMQKEMDDFAACLADFTGRASLGKAAPLAPAIGSLFFAPRLALARLLTPRHLVSANPRVRMEAWRNLVTFVGGFGGLVLLGDLLGLWEVEKDPRNAEFMSIRVGKTRIDPWGGYRPYLVFLTRVITGTGMSSVTGKEYEVDPLMAGTHFVRGKGSPLASIIADFWTGRTFIGDKVDVANQKQWLERIAPFAVWDVYEAYMEDPLIALGVMIPAIVGMGVQTYTGDWEENWPKLGLPKYSDNLPYGLAEPYYDAGDFWSDTSSQFAGVDPSTLTADKGFPAYIRAIAEARLIKEHLESLPNERLSNINADPEEGTTFAQYYQMWRERQKIVASGDEEKLKEFDQDERTRNANLGNFSQRQFALLNQYYALTDDKEREEFLEEHEAEIGINPRQDYLRRHPKENAQLAVWGQAKIFTQEAYDETKRLLAELDIPDNAVPAFTLPPEGSIENYFAYMEKGEELGYNSWEVQLIIAQDEDLRIFLDRQRIETPAGALELKTKHRPLFEQYEDYGDDESPWYLEDDDAREDAREKLKADNPEWVDDMRRIEAIEHQATDDMIERWVERGRLVDQFTAGSSEVKVWLFNHPDVMLWALEEELLTDDGSDWNIPVLGINARWRAQDEEYEALETAAERKDYLARHREYRMDRRRRDAYRMEGFPSDRIEDYVAYYELPDKGFRRERYLIEHPAFATAMHEIAGMDLPDPKKIPAVGWDETYEKWKDQFDRFWGMSDHTSVHYVEDVELRGIERDKMRYTASGEPTEFYRAEKRLDAYELFFPKEHVENFVDYFTLPRKGMRQELFLAEHPDFAAVASSILHWQPTKEKHIESLRISVKYEDMDEMYSSLSKDDRQPFLENNPAYADARRRRAAYDYGFPDNLINVYAEYYKIGRAGYEDDWFLMEHPDFYQAALKLLEWEPRNFSKVPSRAVFALYTAYLELPKGDPRMQYRLDHPELDDWLVLAKGYKPASEERELTGKEKDAYEKRKEAAEAQALKDWIERQ